MYTEIHLRLVCHTIFYINPQFVCDQTRSGCSLAFFSKVNRQANLSAFERDSLAIIAPYIHLEDVCVSISCGDVMWQNDFIDIFAGPIIVTYG